MLSFKEVSSTAALLCARLSRERWKDALKEKKMRVFWGSLVVVSERERERGLSLSLSSAARARQIRIRVLRDREDTRTLTRARPRRRVLLETSPRARLKSNGIFNG